MTAALSPTRHNGQVDTPMPAEKAPDRPACAVSLVDRRTGHTHRVNGSPLVIYTRAPDLAAAELLDGRDASVWEVRVQSLAPEIAA